jgi:hypothetical protein
LAAAIFIKNFYRTDPSLPLAIVDLSQIKHRPLQNPPTRAATILHNGPIVVFLAVFDSPIALQTLEGKPV